LRTTWPPAATMTSRRNKPNARWRPLLRLSITLCAAFFKVPPRPIRPNSTTPTPLSPLQLPHATGRGGPKGSGLIKAPDFLDVRHYEGGRLSAISTSRLYPRRNPWYSFSGAKSTSEYMVLSGGATEKIHLGRKLYKMWKSFYLRCYLKNGLRCTACH